MRYRMDISYDGTNFYGFQVQNDLRCVQTVLEEALSKICKSKIKIHASGRTDKHVHAKMQVIHFDTDVSIPPHNFKRGMNSLLPMDIYVNEVYIVDESFHARFSIIEKEYRYYINTNEYDPFKANYMLFMYNFDLNIMKEAIKLFIGTHDFRNFTQLEKDKNTVRTITKASINENNGIVEISISGTGFLKYMVRRIVGCLLDIGFGKIDIEYINTLFDSKELLSTKKVLPNGLFLYNIIYG